MVKKISTPLTKEKVKDLRIGDSILLTGTIYTGRDAAHKRLVDLLERGEKLPINIEDEIIYYVGPTPPKPGKVIGSAGPTTSYRMDSYAPKLLELGMRGMIGKGVRSKEVIESIVKNKGVYFGAIGGVGALISKCIVNSEVVLYEDLGAEAVRKIEVKELPLIVIVDSYGNNLYEEGRLNYLKNKK